MVGGVVTYVSIGLTIVTVIINIITLLSKNKKNTVLGIIGKIASYVCEAESIFGAGNGQAKLNWVLTKVQIDAVKANVKIEDETIINQVENVLSTPQKK